MSPLQRHAALRWIGVALFIAALPGVAVLLLHVVTGKSPVGHVMNCVLALGLSLGAFGTNNDTAVHAMRELARSRCSLLLANRRPPFFRLPLTRAHAPSRSAPPFPTSRLAASASRRSSSRR
jgi:hypothetical protein